jgi:hypothetical protein
MGTLYQPGSGQADRLGMSWLRENVAGSEVFYNLLKLNALITWLHCFGLLIDCPGKRRKEKG